MTVDLTAVANAQSVGITLINANDGLIAGDVFIPLGVLIGDSNGDAVVNSGDAVQTRSRSGQTTDGTNFRSDFNVDGAINSGDVFDRPLEIGDVPSLRGHGVSRSNVSYFNCRESSQRTPNISTVARIARLPRPYLLIPNLRGR